MHFVPMCALQVTPALLAGSSDHSQARTLCPASRWKTEWASGNAIDSKVRTCDVWRGWGGLALLPAEEPGFGAPQEGRLVPFHQQHGALSQPLHGERSQYSVSLE